MDLLPHSRTCLICDCAEYVIAERFPDPKCFVPSYAVCRCSNCGFLYTDPQPPPDLIGQYYESDYSSWHLTSRPSKHRDSHWYRWTYFKYLGYEQLRTELNLFHRLASVVLGSFYAHSAVAPRGDKLGTLLDVGCGSGQFLGLMSHLGWTVSGLEPSPVACRLAAERWGIEPINGWIEDVSARDFDVVSMCGVIEHLHDPLDSLRKIRALLKPGGRVFITTHDISGPGPRLYGTHWVGWEVPQHLYFFDQNSICKILEKAGFHSVRIRKYFRTIDLFNTLQPGRLARYSKFFLSGLFLVLGLNGGLIVEAEK